MFRRHIVVGLALAVLTAGACSSPPRESRARAAQAESAVRVDDTPPPGPAPDGMVWIPGGTFWMGCEDCGMPDAKPVHLVTVAGFWMDQTPVTNAQFARFVKETGYVTVAERPLSPKDFPGVPPDKLVPGSAVFVQPHHAVSLENPMQWWQYVAGANWKHPEGPGSSIAKRNDHPVVHVAYEDALSYLKWTGRRLPTEAEYEFAARGGLDRQRYAWGNELKPHGTWAANIWQGRFPSSNTVADGHTGTSPVTAFAPNPFNVYDVGGNVWQWCADWYRDDYYGVLAASNGPARNPTGPERSHDPDEPGASKRVVRGGSFLCSDQYCSRYLVGSRGKAEVGSGASNLGFRGALGSAP